jgi:hypothetical protein
VGTTPQGSWQVHHKLMYIVCSSIRFIDDYVAWLALIEQLQEIRQNYRTGFINPSENLPSGI